MLQKLDPQSGVVARTIRGRYRATALRLASFGLVGGVAFIVDVGMYNVLRLTVLDDKPIAAKVISVAAATVISWVGSRFVTFKEQRSGHVAREALLFVLMNVIGLCISAGCLWLSHYVLGFISPLADNLAGNVIGLGLGTGFRYYAYAFVVFRQRPVADTVSSRMYPPPLTARPHH